MKKLIYLFALSIGAVGCSVDSLDSEQLTVADARYSAVSTATATITPPEGILCAGEELTFTVTVSTESNFQVQQKIAGEWEQVYLANQGQDGSETFKVVLALGENEFRHTNLGSGSNWVIYSTSFTGTDCNTCEDSLIADLVCGDVNTLTVSFTAEEAGPIVIQGGLTNGTEIISAESNILERNTTHNGVENSNSNVTRWEGEVEACEEVTIEITFSGGNGIGDWSAKREIGTEEVTLAETEEQSCTVEE